MPLKIVAMEDPVLNLTPMIDVVFNLMIFFMLATHFADLEREFDVDLPEVSAAQPLTSQPDEIVVNVFADGRIVVSEQTLSLAQLQSRLEQARTRFADQAVLVRGDGRGAYQQVMDVLATCHAAGLHNFSLATNVKAQTGAAP